MIAFVVRRLLISIPLLVVVSVVVFLLMSLTPGDPAALMLGPDATQESIAALRTQMGLDRPLAEQYVLFLVNLAQGDLGRSFVTHLPVGGELLRAWPATFQIAVVAMIIALAIGLPLGAITAIRRGSWVDQVTRIAVLVGISMPIFWSGLLLIYFFAVQLGWLPTSGTGTPAHLILPAVSLSTFSIAVVLRLTRSSMIEVLQEDYVRTARSKGLREWVVVVRHALMNALIPVVTIVGLQFGQLLSGAAITETVFNWPGMGRLVVTAVFARDYPMIRGAILLIAATFIIVNLIVDVLYAVLDPRIRYA
ncbi:MAG: peptide/nickel transport system permease protein [Chloroflexota bacterium]|jgi:ABC-type dipeptide/oligopeptide/nickel transport system permease component|nr:peptide/nickel transport system permease protein [Chloroflexota bacterium]